MDLWPEEDAMDYEPLSEFWPPEENADWFRAWTGNQELDGGEFRVFAGDGAGGVMAFWLVAPDREVAAQPVVFLSSEGETGVVALNLTGLIQLMAQGVGPSEAVCEAEQVAAGQRWYVPTELTELAKRIQGAPAPTPMDLLSGAGAAYPGFRDWINSCCR